MSKGNERKEITSRVNSILELNNLYENKDSNLTWDKYAHNRISEKCAIQSFHTRIATKEELKALDMATVRPSLLDALEETVYLLNDVQSVSRIRTIKKHEFQDVLMISFYDENDIQIFSSDGTFVMEGVNVKNI
ncbi:hypothetical protein [Roseburia sp. 499]|uniref:hypothetical protein n=1 Tax=Roseburia sp. 499 TaxID=1261634 RepID=UPI0009525E9D|nr:hypothetical protein [Roseburia sp. 499]WVK69503.1 hypothetical protein BIV20_14245 [Roseburia sp. 499]